jgi:ATP-binding cassette subfamily B protein
MSFSYSTELGETAPKEQAWAQGLRLARAHPRLYAISAALFCIFYLLPLLPGLLQREIFDTLTGKAAAGLNVWSLVALLFGAQLLPHITIYLAFWAFQRFNYVVGAMVRANMLGWMMLAPGARRAPGPPGEAVSRFRDDVQEIISFVGGWIDVFGQAVYAVIALSLMYSINPGVTLAVIAPMLAVVAITQRITAGIHKYSRVAREAGARVTGFVGEAFSAVQAIRVAGAEPRILDRLDSLNDERRRTAVRYRIYVALLETFGVGTSSFALGLVLLLSASAMRDGQFTVGDFTLFASYVGWATSAPRWLGRLLARKRTADVAHARVDTLLGDAPAPVQSAPGPRAPADPGPYEPLESLSVHGLSYRFPSSNRGVEGVDLTLRRGSVTIVTGRVGSGKTTLLRAILGLVPAQAGQIRWNGDLVADPASFFVPPRCAYTAQAPRLFSESLRANVLMGVETDEAHLRAAVEHAILEDDVARLEAGLDTLVGTRGVTLSGGQVQRAAAARMFVRETDLLVFDDASSALDVQTERLFWERLFTGGRRTCLAVSHRLEAYRRADEIILLEEGRVAARGDLRTLMRDSALFREIWREAGNAPAEAKPAS